VAAEPGFAASSGPLAAKVFRPHRGASARFFAAVRGRSFTRWGAVPGRGAGYSKAPFMKMALPIAAFRGRFGRAVVWNVDFV